MNQFQCFRRSAILGGLILGVMASTSSNVAAQEDSSQTPRSEQIVPSGQAKEKILSLDELKRRSLEPSIKPLIKPPSTDPASGDGDKSNMRKPEPYTFEKKGGVVYSVGQDFELKCDVYVPDGVGPFPAIVAIHGGAWRSGSKLHMLRHAWQMAKRGYVVMAINYRHAPSHKFPAQIHDAKQAVRWLRKHADVYKVDTSRIGGYGYSAGGHLVSLLATTQPADGLEGTPNGETGSFDSSIKAAIVGGGPCEFSWLSDNSRVLSYWLDGSRKKNPENYRLASATNYVDSRDPPTYFYQGTKDRVVPNSAPKTLYEKMTASGVVCKFVDVEGRGHFGTFSDFKAFDSALDFFDKRLKDTGAKAGKSAIRAAPISPKNSPKATFK